MEEDRSMRYFSTNIENVFQGKEWTSYTMAEELGIPSSRLSQWREGRRRPTDKEIEKLANSEELGLSREILMAWRSLDDYGEHVIRLAAQILG